MQGDSQIPTDLEIAFGPVPSRRLGRSLGIDNIPPKTCTYACIYCQLGPTIHRQAQRAAFYPPDVVDDAVRAKVEAARRAGEAIDYLTFVPAGEATLDVNLGEEIRRLRPLGIPIAVITNASLVGQEEVRADLAGADWVSLKVDAVDPTIWRALNRPHRELRLDAMLEGARLFARAFEGTLATETMLVEGANDHPAHLEAVAGFVAELAPATAYLSVPTRPPAHPSVRPPDEHSVNRAYQIFTDRLPSVECLLGYEGSAFASTGDPETDLLSITAVHPMREDAVMRLLERTHADASVLRGLVEDGRLVETPYGDHTYYVRALRRATAP
jgi:wyosine [tRNA(Phe)-imidazoG37] synthetase (radical SAM superfamily)